MGGVLHNLPMRLRAACIAIACSFVCGLGFAAAPVPKTAVLNARPRVLVNQKRGGDPRDLHRCKLRASRPADNDIRLDTDRPSNTRPADLPAPVARRILDRVSAEARTQFTVHEWREARQSCADIFPPVLRLTGPAGLQLYVAPRDFVLGNSVDFFLMYDPLTGAVTRSPPLIFTKWSKDGAGDPLIKAPVVRMEPAWGGRAPMLIVEERTHNGNMYDAAVYRYFEIGKDMSLKQVLAVEARAILLSNPNDYTERKATFLTPNRVRLDVFTGPPRKLRAGGSVLLERARGGQPFHVARRMPARGTRGESLVAYCATVKNDDDFLRSGCNFYY